MVIIADHIASSYFKQLALSVNLLELFSVEGSLEDVKFS
jgi:hypothetical protein